MSSETTPEFPTADTTTQPDPDESYPDELIETMAEFVETVIQGREGLEPTLAELHERYAAGENVQAALNEVFARNTALFNLSLAAYNDDLESFLDAAVVRDRLDEETRRAFDQWWESKKWLQNGVMAFRHRNAPMGWTETHQELSIAGDQYVVEHIAKYGVDTVHHVQIPVDRFFMDLLDRITRFIPNLIRLVEEGEVTEETRHLIELASEEFHEVADTLEQQTDAAPEDTPSDLSLQEFIQEHAPENQTSTDGSNQSDEGDEDSDEQHTRMFH